MLLGRKFFGAALLLALGACSQPSGLQRAADPEADKAAINAIGDLWMAAYEAGDYDAIIDLYTEDAWIMARGRPKLEGREAIGRSFGGLAAGRKVNIDIVVEELEVIGDWGWLVSEFTVSYGTGSADKPPATDTARSLLIYRRGVDGKWRIHRDMDSPAPDVDMKPPAAH
jgi:uncharacterized protein (TIGR02246 family)